MSSPILPISPAAIPEIVRPSLAPSSGDAFQEIFAGAIRNVEAAGKEASASVERFLSGEGEELHNTILATTRAELGFDLFLQMRNKVVGAYQEVMKMQL
jgi:flagellar hook-basal body complex protein FliE